MYKFYFFKHTNPKYGYTYVFLKLILDLKANSSEASTNCTFLDFILPTAVFTEFFFSKCFKKKIDYYFTIFCFLFDFIIFFLYHCDIIRLHTRMILITILQLRMMSSLVSGSSQCKVCSTESSKCPLI